jgi:hypothetical protein
MASTFKETDFVKVLHDGMLKGVRDKTISLLMTSLEKEVAAAVDKQLSEMKGYVEHTYGPTWNEPTFNILINGVPYKHETT